MKKRPLPSVSRSRSRSPTHYLEVKGMSNSNKTRKYNKNEDIINEVLDYIRKPSTLENVIVTNFLHTPLNGLLEHFNFGLDINLADPKYNFDFMAEQLIIKIDEIIATGAPKASKSAKASKGARASGAAKASKAASDGGLKKILYGRIKNYRYDLNKKQNNETHFQTFAIFVYEDGRIFYHSFDPASGCLPCKKGHRVNIYAKQATDELTERLESHYSKVRFTHVPNKQEVKCQYNISIEFAGVPPPLSASGKPYNIKKEEKEDFAFEDVNCQTWCVYLLYKFLESYNEKTDFYNVVPDNTEARYKIFYDFILNKLLIHNKRLHDLFNTLQWQDLLVHIHPISGKAVVPKEDGASEADALEKTRGGGEKIYKTTRINAVNYKPNKKTKKKGLTKKTIRSKKPTKRRFN